MSQPPKGWTSTKLGDVLQMQYGQSLPAKLRVPGRFRVYGSNGSVGTHETSVTNGPAIIVGRKGSIGEVHFSEHPCFPIDTTYYVDNFEVCDARFTLQLLNFLPLKQLNRATAIPGLNREDAYALEVNVPPLLEQRRIMAKIDSLSAKSRRARENLDHIPRLVEKYKQAIMAAAFRGELTREWRSRNKDESGWITSTIGDVATIASGQTPKGVEAALSPDGEIPWFKVSSMNARKFGWPSFFSIPRFA